MAVDHIRYDLLAQQALRGVLRSVLADAAKKGLPGEHHFYISFDTHAQGVRISERLRAQHPDEMTIVLQHQFWDLVVGDDGFEVGLSFGGIPERLVVPFDAVKGFFDPSVQFGLQFETVVEADDAAAETGSKPAPAPPAAKSAAKSSAQAKQGAANQGAPAVPVPAGPATDIAAAAGRKPDKPAGTGEVVRLDRFRKK